MDEIIKSNIETIFQQEEIDGNTEENFKLIIQYYHTLNDDGKTLFQGIIKNEKIVDVLLNKPSQDIKGHGFLYIKIIVYLGMVKECMKSTVNKTEWYGLLSGYKDILSQLNEDDANLYAQDLISLIMNLKRTGETYADHYLKIYKGSIAKEIVQWKMGNIKLKVNQVDVEIESDQSKVIELIEEFGFDPEFNKFLTQLRSKNISEEDELQFAGTIATFREFFGKIIISIAGKIAEFNSEPIPEYEGDDGKSITLATTIARRYIKEKGNLSDKENKLINGYVDILHKEGGHNMFSSQKYFRLTKNIGIEILYMLLSKAKEFQ